MTYRVISTARCEFELTGERVASWLNDRLMLCCVDASEARSSCGWLVTPSRQVREAGADERATTGASTSPTDRLGLRSLPRRVLNPTRFASLIDLEQVLDDLLREHVRRRQFRRVFERLIARHTRSRLTLSRSKSSSPIAATHRPSART